MSDNTPTTPAKDPLAVLEELLAKQKQGGGAISVEAPAGPDPAVVAAQELAQKQAEVERMQAEASARDAALLAQQSQKMQEIATSPQYQARVEQNEAVKQEKQHAVDEQQGFEIHQLTTTRVLTVEDSQPST